jgi:membrane-bound hydrogenase subunit mbhJ
VADINERALPEEDDAPEETEDEALAAETEAFVLPPPARHHAVWIMSLNMGSCSGCDQQIQAMLAPRYQLSRRGITFATSPRHADVILLTGTLTRRSLEPVKRILAQVPDPHALIAVGDCALHGGVFADSPEIIANAADALAVNVEIAGNPPTPAQIVLAIEEAARLLDSAEAGETAEEAEAEEETTPEDEETEDFEDEDAGDEEELEEEAEDEDTEDEMIDEEEGEEEKT